MAAGTQATKESWRWSYRTMGICNAIIFILFIFFYEETKYFKVIEGVTAANDITETPVEIPVTGLKGAGKGDDLIKPDSSKNNRIGPSSRYHELDNSIPLNSRKERLALLTATSEPIWPHYYRPFIILFSFPAVLFSGLQYASGVVWLTIMSSVLARVFPLPPYNFTPEQIGFLSVGPFIGNLIGALYGGFLGDRSILYYSRRNKGYYEPEMRLYILHLPALTMCGGIIMFGVTISKARICHTNLYYDSLTSSRACIGSCQVLQEPFSGSASAVLATLP
jgi:hypothetical protein